MTATAVGELVQRFPLLRWNRLPGDFFHHSSHATGAENCLSITAAHTLEGKDVLEIAALLLLEIFLPHGHEDIQVAQTVPTSAL